MAVALRCETARGRPYAARLRAAARRVMALCDLSGCELSIVLADDGFVRIFNRDFRGKDRATDVLSFSQLEEVSPGRHPHPGTAGEPGRKPRRAGRLPKGVRPGMLIPAPGAPLGDIVISVDTAERQARRLGVEPEARMRTLLVHGFLHLLGYDHERSPAEARRMFARERELAVSLGCRNHQGRDATQAPAPKPARASTGRRIGAGGRARR